MILWTLTIHLIPFTFIWLIENFLHILFHILITYFIFNLNYSYKLNITWSYQTMTNYRFTLTFIPHLSGPELTHFPRKLSPYYFPINSFQLQSPKMSIFQLLFPLKPVSMSSTCKATGRIIMMSPQPLPLQEHQCQYQRQYLLMSTKPVVPWVPDYWLPCVRENNSFSPLCYSFYLDPQNSWVHAHSSSNLIKFL